MKVQKKLAKTYQNDQLEDLQGQTNKTWNSIEDKQFQSECLTLNELSRRKII